MGKNVKNLRGFFLTHTVVANSVHTADATHLSSWVASASAGCTGLRSATNSSFSAMDKLTSNLHRLISCGSLFSVRVQRDACWRTDWSKLPFKIQLLTTVVIRLSQSQDRLSCYNDLLVSQQLLLTRPICQISGEFLVRLSGVVVRASDSWPKDREFDSRPVHCRVA